MKKILVLYTRLTGYWLACMRYDYQSNQNQYLVIKKSSSPDAPFNIISEDGIEVIDGDDLDSSDILQYAKGFYPDLVYIAGWSDKRFKKVGKHFKENNKPVIVGMDNHWLGSPKQKIGALFSKSLVKDFCTHLWIPGSPQLFFAKKLGFKDNEILKGLYCADENIFKNINQTTYKKQVLFVGRLVEHKGLKVFFRVLEELILDGNLNFDVKIIGNGPLKDQIPQHPSVKHIPFVKPEELPKLLENAGFFMLSSLYEAWGVVLHEAVIAGLPVISTYQTGAASEFVLHNYNGYLYDANQSDQLKEILLKINSISEEEYLQMSKNSKSLSERIKLDYWSATINSIS